MSGPISGGTVGVGVVGLGFMGTTHVQAYQAAAKAGWPCRLVAVADKSAERLTGRASGAGNIGTGTPEQIFDPAQVRCYFDPRQVLEDPNVHLVSVCTHTDTHVDLAIAALRAGKHVLVEKPVAITSAEVQRLAKAAAESGKLCMPAMCMRFWPEWAWLREAVRSGVYGKAVSATFQRLGAPPTWTDFYRDVHRSGGSLIDLHIHDTDFIRWCFGEPAEVVSTGTLMHVSTIFRYPGGPTHVLAEGGQDYAPGFGFKMRYVVGFERATAEFDLARTPALMLHTESGSEGVALPAGKPESGYDGEIRHLVRAIADGTPTIGLTATIDDAVRTMQLLEAERRSLETGRAQAL